MVTYADLQVQNKCLLTSQFTRKLHQQSCKIHGAQCTVRGSKVHIYQVTV